MNREELNTVLNEMDEEERRLVLNADDAYDALYAYRIHKDYGVDVICNPNGDRTKISIDGVIMGQAEFAEWVLYKELEKYKAEHPEEDTEEELPSEVIVDVADLGEEEDLETSPELERAVKKYLRVTYGHCLARGAELDIELNEDDTEVYVNNITWGRKLSSTELADLM